MQQYLQSWNRNYNNVCSKLRGATVALHGILSDPLVARTAVSDWLWDFRAPPRADRVGLTWQRCIRNCATFDSAPGGLRRLCVPEQFASKRKAGPERCAAMIGWSSGSTLTFPSLF